MNRLLPILLTVIATLGLAPGASAIPVQDPVPTSANPTAPACPDGRRRDA